MKLKYFNFLFTLIIFSLSVSVFAQETNICVGKKKIPYDDSKLSLQFLSDELLAYDKTDYLYNGAYYLCLDLKSDVPMLSSSLIFQKKNNSPVYIVGLNIQADSNIATTIPLFSITNDKAGTVYVKNINLSSVKSGLSLTGTGSGKIVIENSIITGTGSSTGACVDIRSNGAVIKGNILSNCGYGIKLAAEGVKLGALTEDRYLDDQDYFFGGLNATCDRLGEITNRIKNNEIILKDSNIIACNGKGIVGTGSGLWWGNSYFKNGNSTDNAIVLNNIKKPAIFPEEDGLSGLRCLKDNGGKLKQCELHIGNVSGEGIISIHQSDSESGQGINYLTSCRLTTDNLCSLSETQVAQIPDDNSCATKHCYFTVLFTSLENMTSKFSNAFPVIPRMPSVPSIDTTMPVELTGVNGNNQAVANPEADSGQNVIVASNEPNTPILDGNIPTESPQSDQVEDKELTTAANAIDGSGAMSGVAHSCSLSPNAPENNLLFYFVIIQLAGLSIIRYCRRI